MLRFTNLFSFIIAKNYITQRENMHAIGVNHIIIEFSCSTLSG